MNRNVKALDRSVRWLGSCPPTSAIARFSRYREIQPLSREIQGAHEIVRAIGDRFGGVDGDDFVTHQL